MDNINTGTHPSLFHTRRPGRVVIVIDTQHRPLNRVPPTSTASKTSNDYNNIITTEAMYNYITNNLKHHPSSTPTRSFNTNWCNDSTPPRTTNSPAQVSYVKQIRTTN